MKTYNFPLQINSTIMSTYTFTVSVGFNLATHRVQFANKRLQVILSSTSEMVYNQDYTNGIAFRCQGNEFQIGTLSASQVFTKQVDLSKTTAKLWIKEVSNNNLFVGSDNGADPSVFNTYRINNCPVQVSASGNIAYMKCPCENASGPCGNSCYTYGN